MHLPTPVTAKQVAEQLFEALRLTDAGARREKREAARAHAEALCRRWRLSLREEQAAEGRDLLEGSIASAYVGMAAE